MAFWHHRINHRIIIRCPRIVKRAEVRLELRERLRPGNHARYKAIGEHPRGGELQQREAFALGVHFELLRDHERFFTPLGLHEAFVRASGARVRRRCIAGLVFPGEHAARNGAVRRHTDAVEPACRQDFNLRQAIQQVVIRLTNCG